MKKKVLAAILSVTMVMTSFTTICGEEFFGETDEVLSDEAEYFEETETSDMSELEVFQADFNDIETVEVDSYLQSNREMIENVVEVKAGKVYTRGVTKDTFSYWYKFVPEKDEQYNISFESPEHMYFDYEIYSENDFSTPLGDIDVDVDAGFLKSGIVYYIKVMVSWEETEKVPQSFSMRITRYMDIEDYVREIVRNNIQVERMPEADKKGDKAYITAQYNDDTGNTVMKFIPKYTGLYRFVGEEGFQNPNSAANVYDAMGNRLPYANESRENTPDGSYILNENNVYYIASDEGFKSYSTQYIPDIVSLKIIEGPSRTYLYRGWSDFIGRNPGVADIWLPGIKLEVVYENGKQETISEADINHLNKRMGLYDYKLRSHLDGVSERVPQAGIYCNTISMGGQKIRIENVEIKESNQVPLIEGEGCATVICGIFHNGVIGFRAEKAGKYSLSTSSAGNIFVWDDNLYDNGFPREFILAEEGQEKQVIFEKGKYYYIGWSGEGESEISFEVKKIADATIKLNAKSIPLKEKQSTTSVKINEMMSGDKIVSWKSSNKKVATVDSSGKITGKKAGEAIITVTLKSGVTASLKVTVQKETVTTTKITGVSKNITLKRGKALVLKPVLSPLTSQEKITYSSSDKNVATVSSKGKITAKKKGTAIVTVRSGKKTVKCKVTVK